MKAPEQPLDDPRVIEAARAYLAELEAGRRPNRNSYLAQHPDLQTALAECLDGIELAHQAGRAMSAAPEAAVGPGMPLGDFQILREVGRGGMGIVYEAVQLSLGRRVALKVLPFAAALDEKHLQRFKTEAYAAAQLHHTNIVPVYAVGCERGVHFYAMQIIDGRSIDRIIRELRREKSENESGGSERGTKFLKGPGETRAGLSATTGQPATEAGFYRTVARIAVQIAEALEYAHDAGVVHRDIKPANLLLDAKGNVWITDFGLAQVTADVGLTQTGDVFGTLCYMSPEQASGRRVSIDQRTDVYSLGATLYQFLTLEPLFSGDDRHTLLHQVLNDEPVPLRQIDRSIPVELETIVLKSVAKSPADRYASAGEMAADLRRFLDERPILARRPSRIDQARKWARRHPSLVAAVLILLVFGVIGLSVTTAVIALAQVRTNRAYHRERQRATEAEERFQLARRSADDMIRIANEELANDPGQQNLRRRLLESALEYYQEFIELRRDDPNAQAELAATFDKVKQILADLAVLQGAWQHLLLGEQSVRDDLELNGDQRRQIDELLSRIGARKFGPPGEFRPPTPEERSKQLLEEVKTHQAAIEGILSPIQLRRLRQIALQIRGLAAFREPDVIAELKLSAEKRDMIRVIERDLFFTPGDRFPPGPPNGPPRRIDKKAIQAAIAKAVTTVLSPEQAQQWQAMTGKPFDGPMPMFLPGPPGMFGPPPGGPPPKG